MKPKYGVGIFSSFLVLFAYFSCSEMETVGFSDRSQTCFHGQEDRGAGCFPLQAGEHLARGMKHPDIPIPVPAASTSTHHFLTETNVTCSQLSIAHTHERGGIHFLSHDGEIL